MTADNGNVNEYSLVMKQKIQEKGEPWWRGPLTIIPFWQSKSFWTIRETLNEMETERNWHPGKAFDVITGICFFIFIILLTWVTSA